MPWNMGELAPAHKHATVQGFSSPKVSVEKQLLFVCVLRARLQVDEAAVSCASQLIAFDDRVMQASGGMYAVVASIAAANDFK